MKKNTLFYFVILFCLYSVQVFSQTFNEVENNDNISAVLASTQPRIYSIANYQGTVTSSNSDFWVLSRSTNQSADKFLYFDRTWVNNNPNFDFRVWEYRGGNWGVTPVNIGTLRTLMQTSGIYNYTLRLPYSNNLDGTGNSRNYYAIEIVTTAPSTSYNFHLNGSTVNGYYYCYGQTAITPSVIQTNDNDLKVDFPNNFNPNINIIVKFSATNSFTDFTNNYIQNQALPVAAVSNSYSGSGEHIAYVGRAGDLGTNATVITNLARNTTYYYKIYYYLDCNGYISYTNNGTVGSQTTCPGTTPNVATVNSVNSTETTAVINSLGRPTGADSSTGYLVKFSDTNSFTAPITGTTIPTASTDYSGKTGEQVVYTGAIGSGTGMVDNINQTVSGLQINKDYFVKVYAYNLCGGKYNFETTGSAVVTTNYTCVAPATASNLIASGSGTTSMNISSFTAAPAPANGTLGYIIKVSDANSFTAPTSVPSSPNTVYNSATGGEQVVYVGAGITPNLNITGLNQNTTYYVKVYTYNTCAGNPYFETTGSTTINVTTCGIPTGNSELNTFRTDLHWENRVSPIISNVPVGVEGQVVKMNIENSFTDITGEQNSLPTANTTYSGSGEQVILAGTFPNGQAFTGHNLLPNTQYFFKIYSYKVCGGKYYFSNTTDEISTYTAGVTSNLVSNVTVNNFSGSAFTLASFSAPSNSPSGNPKGYIVKMNTTNSFTPHAFRTHLPAANANYSGGEQTVYIGTSTTPNINITGVNPNQTYYFTIYAYRDSGSPYFFNSFQQTGYEFSVVNSSSLQSPTITFNNQTVNANDANFNLNATSNSPSTINYRIIDAGGTDISLGGTNNATVTIGSKSGTVILEAYQAATATYQSGSQTMTLTINKQPATLAGGIFYQVNSGATTIDMTQNITSNSTGGYTFEILGNTLGYSVNGNLLNVNNVAGSIVIKVTQAAAGNYGETVAYYSTLFFNTGFSPKTEMAHNLFDFSLDMGKTKNIITAKNFGSVTTTYSIVNDGGTGSTINGNVFTAGNRPGTVTLRASSPSSTLYNASTKDVTVTITGTLPQNITFGALAAKSYGDAGFNLAATSNSGLPVSYSSSNTAVATISGNQVTIVGVGSTTITASQAGNSIYDPATNVQQVLTVNKRTVEVTAEVKTKEYGNSDPALTYQITSGSLAGSDAFTGNLVRIAGENVGNYAINQGTLALNSNYTLNFVSNNLSITKRTIQVTADAKTKVYGDTDPSLTYQITSGSLVGSDAFIGNLVRVAGDNIGNYTINKGSLALNANYTLNFSSNNLSITKRAIQVTADAKIKTYGEVDPILTYQITSGSLVGSDAFTGSLTRVAGETVFNNLPSNPFYPISQGTLALSANYNLTFVGANFRIAPKNVNFSLQSATKIYGTADPVPTMTIVDGTTMANGDVLTLRSAGRATGENSGEYAYGGVGFTFEITSSGSTDVRNYQFNFRSYGSPKLTITKRAIEVTADVKSKVYGDTDPTLTYQITSGSLAGSDAFTGSLARVSGNNIGDYAINQGTLALTSNYTLSYVPKNLTITKRAIGITVDAKSKVYGYTDPALTYQITSGSLAGSDAFTGSLTRVAGENIGDYVINQGTLALNSNYTIAFTSNDLTINKRNILILVPGQEKEYGEAEPSLSYGLFPGSILVIGDSFSGNLTREPGENVGTYNINLGTLSLGGNYNVSLVETPIFEITKKAIEVTVDAKSKVFGETDPALTYQITSGSLVGSDAFTGSLIRVTGENVGNYAINQGTLALAGNNYNLTFVGANLVITKVTAVVTISNVSQNYDGSAKPVTVTTNPNGLPVNVTYAGGTTVPTNAGSYAVVATINDTNYQGSANNTLVINKINQSITFNSLPSVTYGDTSFNLTATGGASGNSITYTSSDTSVATISGNTVTIVGAGTTTITASQSGNGNYNAATNVQQVLTVAKKAIEVTADAKTKIYGEADPTFTYQITSGNLVGSDAFTGNLTRVSGQARGNYAINQGTLALNANYNLTFVSGNLYIDYRFIRIVPTAALQKTYGEADPTKLAFPFTITQGSLAYDDAVEVFGTFRDTGENVGGYQIRGLSANFTSTNGGASSYSITYTHAGSARLLINAKPIEITADVKNKVYGDADPTLTYQITNGSLVGSDAFTGALTRATGENIGTYAISQGNLSLGSNYIITFVGSNLTIGKRVIQVTANSLSKEYGNADPTLTYQITSGSLAGSDVFTGALTRVVGETLGNYVISQGTLTLNANYTMNFVGSNFIINKRVIEVTADAKTKTYGDSDPALTYQITSGSLVGGDMFTGSLERVSGENTGNYTINQGTLALNGNYTINYVSRNLNITQRAIQVTADAKTKTYGDTDPALTYQISSGSLVGADAFTGSLVRVLGENVGDYTINQGTLALNANYAITYVPAILKITAASNQSIWDGSTSAVWTERTNWSNDSAPTNTKDVLIPNVGTTPIINGAVTAQMNSLTINNSSNLTIGADGAAVVETNFDNNGTVQITATATNSGTLLVKGNANGTVTYTRGGLLANKWSMITAPVIGQSIKEFAENPTNNIRVNTTVTPNRYAIAYYDDSRAAGTKWVYYTTTDLATNNLTFEKGKSYIISRATDGAVSFNGTIETADVNKAVIASEWNAVGNPYTAFLPMNGNSNVNFINDNLNKFDPAFVGGYTWDNTQNKYVANSLISASKVLAPGQGFFVKAKAGTSSLMFNKAQRSTQPVSGGTFGKASSNIPEIILSIRANNVKVNTEISFRENATIGLDPGYDLGNFDGASFDIYTHLVSGDNTQNFTYQSLPNSNYEKMVVPVGVTASEGTKVIFSAESLNLPEGVEVYLEDKKLNELVKLDNTNNYTVTLKEKANGIGRFYLHTKSGVLSVPSFTTEDIKVYNSDSTLFIEGIEGNSFGVSVYNTVGTEVMKGSYKGITKNQIELPQVEVGIYIVRITTTVGTKTKKIIIKK